MSTSSTFVIIYFPADLSCSIRDPGLVDNLQDQVQLLLLEYARQQYPRHAARFGRLLLRLAALRAIPSQALQRVFFMQTVGSASLERVIADIFTGVNYTFYAFYF